MSFSTPVLPPHKPLSGTPSTDPSLPGTAVTWRTTSLTQSLQHLPSGSFTLSTLRSASLYVTLSGLVRLSTGVPGGFSITGEAPLVLGEVAVPVTPSVEHPTTVMPPSKLSISAELLLVMLPHKDALST